MNILITIFQQFVDYSIPQNLNNTFVMLSLTLFQVPTDVEKTKLNKGIKWSADASYICSMPAEETGSLYQIACQS